MAKNFEIVFDNAGGIHVQTETRYTFDGDAAGAATTVRALLNGESENGWDGEAELIGWTEEDIRNGSYIVWSSDEVRNGSYIVWSSDEVRELILCGGSLGLGSGWHNVRALREELTCETDDED